MQLRLEPPIHPQPSFRWKWDPETDILSGAFAAPAEAAGLTTSLEIADLAGCVLVGDVQRGLLCGLDVVVWPDVEIDPMLQLPGRIADGSLVVAMDETDGAPALEVEGPIVAIASADESLFHLAFGDAAVARRIRIADRLVVDLDAAGAIAGFWLVGVPPFEPADDDDF